MINRNFLIISTDGEVVKSLSELLESFNSVLHLLETKRNTQVYEKPETKICIESVSSFPDALNKLSKSYDSSTCFSLAYIADGNSFSELGSFTETVIKKFPLVDFVFVGNKIDSVVAEWEFIGDITGKYVCLQPLSSPAVIAYSLFLMSDRYNLQKILANTERLSIISSVTAGLAHDFNNVITGITTSSELLRYSLREKRVDSDEKVFQNIEAIERSAEQGARLLRSILTIAKNNDGAASNINLNYALNDMIQLCRNILDKTIEFSFFPYVFQTPFIHISLEAFEQLFMNLIVNAAHSMTIMRETGEPQGGMIAISVKSISIPEINQQGWVPGKYFKVDVMDEGVGIDPQKLKYIFDPFYTSKPKNKGTGIGLASVKDILKRGNGYVDVDSTPGKGTTFSVFLPALKDGIR